MKKTWLWLFLTATFVPLLPLIVREKAIAEAPKPFGQVKKLTAQPLNSGFPQAHDTYNGMGTGSDGKIYYVLSTAEYNVSAQMYCYDPATKNIKHLGDITEACSEKGQKAIVQGKSHVNFVESHGKLYFGTHVGFYSNVDGMEKMGIPPAGYKPYPGGHLLSYDLATGQFEDLGIAPHREGILTFNMDTKRGHIFGLTWPTGRFFRYDVAAKEMKDLGPTSAQGENGQGPTYRTICRSIAVDPEDGSAYFSISTGAIVRYRWDRNTLETVAGDDLKKDYFGLYDPNSAGHMGYNWRQTVYHPADRMFYGVHGNSGYLFRFDPRQERVEVLDRITSEPSRRSGMFDQFSYGYLGFTLGPDQQTLYYLTGGPVYVDGKRVAGKSSTAMGESKGIENLHLVTYHIPNSHYQDQGAIFFPDGQRPVNVNSIAVGKDGSVYALSRITEKGHTRTDLMRISAEQISPKIQLPGSPQAQELRWPLGIWCRSAPGGGVKITRVGAPTIADGLGLKPGNIIVAIDDKPISDANDGRRKYFAAWDTINLIYQDGSDFYQVTAPLAVRTQGKMEYVGVKEGAAKKKKVPDPRQSGSQGN